MTVLAVDIGGTKLACGYADGPVTQVPTGEDAWASLTSLLDPVVAGCTAIGVGCGGPMDWPAGIVAPLNIPAWSTGFRLRDKLSERYAVPVRVHNDAVCFAIGEHVGGGWGVDDLLGVVVSTGVGGGIILGGRTVDGAHGNAGHVGHVVVDPDGPACECGGRGCVEAIARGPATVQWARERGSTATDGRSLSALAAAGDPVALQAFARAGRAVGIAVTSVAAVLDVRVVTIGGGLALVPYLWPALQQAVAQHSGLYYLKELRVVPAALSQRAGLTGAAALFDAHYWSGG